MNKITLTISTRLGLEGVVKNELVRLGYKELRVSDGKIELDAELEDIPRLNLWLRCADRVFLKFGEFRVESFDALFEETKSLPWDLIIPVDGSFDVIGKSSKSKLMSVRSCQSIIKKALVEKLRFKYNTDLLHETGAAYTVNFNIHNDIATLNIDTSGTGLNKRGYRKAAGEAPLKETLAAGLVLLSSWDKGGGDDYLLDPLCGSGTILIEAAMIARNIAPGLKRGFAAEKWPIISDNAWKEARLNAYDAISFDHKLHIQGYDNDAPSIKIAVENATIAGVEKDILFEHKAINDLWIDRQFGTVITNPPYGRRLFEYKELNQLYLTFNKIFNRKKSWGIFVLTADSMFPKYFKRSKPDRVRKLYNGNIRVNYYQYHAAL